MKLRTRLAIIMSLILMMVSFHCSDDTRVVTTSGTEELLRVFVTEHTGSMNTVSIHALDPDIYERIDNLGPDKYDFKTEDNEYYDFFFSTVLGEPLNIDPRGSLPDPICITIHCVDLGSASIESGNSANWIDSGNNIDAVTLTTRTATLFGGQVARVRYGGCDQPLELNEWPAGNALGPPDGIFTHLGGGFSSITVRMEDVMKGTLALFERSNTPEITFVYGFPTLDPRLFEKLPELTQEVHDLATGDCELYDLYFSDADGVPLDYSQRLHLPNPVYVTIDCFNLNCDTFEPDSTALWSDADNTLDAIRLSFSGWHRFGYYLEKVEYGVCGQLPVSNQWPAENMLGIPDDTFTRMGGGFSSITVQLADTSS